MDLDKKHIPAIIAIGIVVMLFLGSLIVYPLNPYSYGSSLRENGDGTVTVDMTSNSLVDYHITSFSTDINGDREILLYRDFSYSSLTGEDYENEFYKEFELELKIRNFTHYRFIDSSGLSERILSKGDASNYAIVIASGAFPETVYSYNDGTYDDKVNEWMGAGGVVIWGSLTDFGFHSAKKGSTDWNDTHSQPLENAKLHYGMEQNDKSSFATEKVDIANAISMTQYEVTHGVKIGSNVKELGYHKDGYSSMAFVKISNGGVVIPGGSFMLNVSLAKVAVSGAYAWDTFEYRNGTFNHSHSVTFAPVTDADGVFVYFGEGFSVYGKLYHIGA